MSDIFEKLRSKLLAATFCESYVTVNAAGDVLIENVTHVYECNEIMSRVKTRDGDVTVWGEELEMSSFKNGFVRIIGRISSVEFTKRAGVKNV